MNDDFPWCIICQSPHSLDYCVVAQSFASGQNAQNKKEEEKRHNDVSYNMVNMCDDCMDCDLEETESDLANKRVS